ncbi:MAG: hypothetical protein GY868_03580 [Deltaproteobacteria bacterium]|nr:hypothetical protein [Deltaproteobacteria bacterium]
MSTIIKTHQLSHRNETVIYNTDYAETVRHNSLDSVAQVMHLDKGEVIKHAIKERKTVRTALQGPGGTLSVYIKRHYPSAFIPALFRRFISGTPPDAFDEFNNIIAFHRHGLPTMVPIAAGRVRCGIDSRSYLVTRALAGCRRLDHILAEPGQLSPHRKHEIISRLALLIKNMHACGFNHRDLYLCHILMDSDDNPFIVDLHRVESRSNVPERRLVKDIAALNYSAPHTAVSTTDRLRFLKQYLGVTKLTGSEKKFAAMVSSKTVRMTRHNEKKTPKGSAGAKQ